MNEFTKGSWAGIVTASFTMLLLGYVLPYFDWIPAATSMFFFGLFMLLSSLLEKERRKETTKNELWYKKITRLMTSEEYEKARKELLEVFLNAEIQEEDN